MTVREWLAAILDAAPLNEDGLDTLTPTVEALVEALEEWDDAYRIRDRFDQEDAMKIALHHTVTALAPFREDR